MSPTKAPSAPIGAALLKSLIFIVPLVAAVFAYFGFRGNEIILGVDLGTTYSAIAYSDGKTADIIRNQAGSRTLPSVVAIKDGKFVVGYDAIEISRSNPSMAVIDSKRVIGRSINDPVVLDEIPRHNGRLMLHPNVFRDLKTGKLVPAKSLPCNNCRNDLGFAFPMVNTTVKMRKALLSHQCFEPNSYVGVDESASQELKDLSAHLNSKYFLILTPQAIGCLIVSDLRERAKSKFRYTSFRKTMACIPAEFDGYQRQATLEAFERAGLVVMRTMTEPSAAAMAYNLHSDESIHYVLVFDMGGGTLDVSILFLSKGSFTVIGTAGDNKLGGKDVDSCVLDLMMSSVGLDLSHDDLHSPLCKGIEADMEAERVKIAMDSIAMNEGIDWKCVGAVGNHAEGRLLRKDYEEGCSHLFDRTLIPVQAALDNAGVRMEDIDDIVLVGGSSRIVPVRERLKSFFKKDLKHTVDPDIAVALGAALSRA